uniref:STAS domain-containing protein n=1 Tax=Chaetoceros debilis TaxID=122233 RepID=A0A7S3VC82_9STRA|mmetsp:Transcript_28527/g.43674  ORF Transcript_28527/g.43674 Transcript_28527/m.43674 type:complete len:649 (+) Transcript_28527:154-2100(+)|eukprot:CAMPEP_0194090082 /NCGR_PEP_ID=MMETSP0149-20130528/37360_1 /TAXON_ID=122233 /ORGANISM="Chaetoceros debilis, Strain MM31A-1" /LENGTH=648 /DNA_ID=CAMNT_0038774221 /DNA_START=73 /DNA_END=2019 /DNA_ORIENTATION=-
MASAYSKNDQLDTFDGRDQSFDEEEVVTERAFDDENVEDMKPDKGDMYNEEEYLAEVGEMNCYFVPTRVYGFKDFIYRTLGWVLLNKEQILGGFTVALTQIPEAVAGALIAGVSPVLALQSTWIMNLVCACIGGRPGMMSGTTPFIGIALADLVEKNGQGYVYYAVMFAGFLQMLFGFMGLGALMRFVPYPVVQGFSNAMALYLVAAQFRFGKVDEDFHAEHATRRLIQPGHAWDHITDNSMGWNSDRAEIIVMSIHAAVAFMICLFLPKLTRAIPSSFVALFCCTFLEHVLIRTPSDFSSRLIEDFSIIKVPGQTFIPIWANDSINLPPFNVDTLRAVYLYGFAVFGTGLSESLLATQIVDELTEVKGAKNRVAVGQGAANVISAIFGGMGGSGSIAQSIVANHSDGITNLCACIAGLCTLTFVYGAHGVVNIIPLGAIAGIMIWAAFKLVDWESLLQAFASLLPLRVRDKINLDCKTPRADALTMFAVMAFTLCLDLSIGLLSGVIIAAFVYVWDSSTRVIVEREVNAEESTSVIYNVTGPLFFATAGGFCDIFPLEEIQFDPDECVILLEGAEVYDYSGMVALKKVYDRFADLGKVVALSSISPTSRRLMEKTAYMWQGVNFLEVEEVDASLNDSTLNSGSLGQA